MVPPPNFLGESYAAVVCAAVTRWILRSTAASRWAACCGSVRQSQVPVTSSRWVVCVLRVGPAGSGARDGVHVTRVNPLDSTLVLAVNEELVSNIISIRAVSQVRARALPVCLHFRTFLLPLQRLQVGGVAQW